MLASEGKRRVTVGWRSAHHIIVVTRGRSSAPGRDAIALVASAPCPRSPETSVSS